jgi:hypothetical protein
MQPRLSRAEYWLLETVVESPCALTLVDPARCHEPFGIEAVFNKSGHGLNHGELIDVLVYLVGERLIEGFRDKRPIELDRHTIVAVLTEHLPVDDPSCTFYRLTPDGGNVWQAFATPDWSRLVKEEIDDETRTGTLTGATAWRVEKYLRYLDMLECEIDLPSIRIVDIGPWEATYWKTLPQGHRAHFRWRHQREHGKGNEFSELAFSGFCEFRDQWYNWR